MPITADDVAASADGIGECAPGIGVVTLTWAESDLGADLGWYEGQRSDQFTDWQSIFRITDVTATSFSDYEGRRGYESSYRLRAVDTDGFESAWSPTLTATRPVLGDGYTFTTNEAPELNVAYGDVYEGSGSWREYEFDEAGEAVEQTLAGRDFHVQFQPLERRGVRFQRLLRATNTVPGADGPRLFDPLRDLAKATLDYVCVADEAGNRWFCGITVPSGRVLSADDGTVGLHLMQVTCAEVTDIPSTPDVQAAP